MTPRIHGFSPEKSPRPAVQPASTPPPGDELTLVGMDGFHGHLESFRPVDTGGIGPTSGGAAVISATVASLRRQGSVLFLTGGDAFTGPALSMVFRGQPVVEWMNREVDVFTLGNHDFDMGQQVLADRVAQARFPVLAANLKDAASGQHVSQSGGLLEQVQPYTVKEVAGRRVAVLGLIKESTPLLAFPPMIAGLQFEAQELAIQEWMPRILEEKPDLIVLHSQQLEDGPELLRLAREAAAPGAPPMVFMGGDASTPELVSTEDGVILRGNNRGTELSVLRVDSHRHEYLPVAGIEPDPEVEKLVQNWSEKLRDRLDRPIGQASADLPRAKLRSAPAGNLVADAMRWKTGADVALVAGGTIKGGLAAGPLTQGDMYEVVPFDNRLVTLPMSGRQLYRALEQSAASPKVLQVSGLTMRYDPEAPVGSRVSDVRLQGKPLSPDATYQVAIDDFLLHGGDGYSAFPPAAASQPGELVRDALSQYVESQGTLPALKEPRVFRVS